MHLTVWMLPHTLEFQLTHMISKTCGRAKSSQRLEIKSGAFEVVLLFSLGKIYYFFVGTAGGSVVGFALTATH